MSLENLGNRWSGKWQMYPRTLQAKPWRAWGQRVARSKAVKRRKPGVPQEISPRLGSLNKKKIKRQKKRSRGRPLPSLPESNQNKESLPSASGSRWKTNRKNKHNSNNKHRRLSRNCPTSNRNANEVTFLVSKQKEIR